MFYSKAADREKDGKNRDPEYPSILSQVTPGPRGPQGDGCASDCPIPLWGFGPNTGQCPRGGRNRSSGWLLPQSWGISPTRYVNLVFLSAVIKRWSKSWTRLILCWKGKLPHSWRKCCLQSPLPLRPPPLPQAGSGQRTEQAQVSHLIAVTPLGASCPQEARPVLCSFMLHASQGPQGEVHWCSSHLWWSLSKSEAQYMKVHCCQAPKPRFSIAPLILIGR